MFDIVQLVCMSGQLFMNLWLIKAIPSTPKSTKYNHETPTVKEFRIKQTAHIVNLTEDDDTGNSKNIKEEGDPHKGWRQETNDKKSEEVIERVKLLKVQDPIMNPKKLKIHSPFSDIVNDRTSFI